MYFWGEGDGKRNETEVEGFGGGGITRVWRASLSLHQCQALGTALRYYQEVISSLGPPAYQSQCLSPSFLFQKGRQKKKKHLFVMWLCCLCMNLPRRLAELHYLFTLLSQGTAAKNVEKKTKLNMSSFQPPNPPFPSDARIASIQCFYQTVKSTLHKDGWPL